MRLINLILYILKISVGNGNTLIKDRKLESAVCGWVSYFEASSGLFGVPTCSTCQNLCQSV